MKFKSFVRDCFHNESKLSYSLLSLLFLFGLIAIINFTTVWIDCRNDVKAIHHSVVSKNDICHSSRQIASQNNMPVLESLNDVHKAFDANFLMFLVSFTLVAVLTMLLHDNTNLNKKIEESKKLIESQMASRTNYVLQVSLFKYGFVLSASTIESLEFVINDTVSASIEKLCIGVDDFSLEIPEYSQKLQDEAVFANEDIDSMLKPLYDVKQGIEDLYRAARRRNPDLVPDLEAQLFPVESSVDALICKIEGYRAAPKNQQA